MMACIRHAIIKDPNSRIIIVAMISSIFSIILLPPKYIFYIGFYLRIYSWFVPTHHLFGSFFLVSIYSDLAWCIHTLLWPPMMLWIHKFVNVRVFCFPCYTPILSNLLLFCRLYRSLRFHHCMCILLLVFGVWFLL